MSSTRAFLAIPLPCPLQQEVAQTQAALPAALPGIRLTDPASVHLTLRFFGAATRDDLEKIRASMLSVTLYTAPFPVDLAGVGAFPTRHRPRVVWIGVTPTAQLVALYHKCQSALADAGIATERRPFAPHLTIGRFRETGPDLAALPEGLLQRRIGSLPVESLVLYESRLLPEGARHIPLFTAPLRGALH